MPKPKGNGRPSVYDRKIADRICALIAEGKSLRSICRADDMPARSTVHLWVLDNVDGFSDRYARAQEVRAHELVDECFAIADDAFGDVQVREREDGSEYEVVNHEVIQRARLRVDTRKWYASKVVPKLYGDRLTHQGDKDAPLAVADMTDQTDRAKALAQILIPMLAKPKT